MFRCPTCHRRIAPATGCPDHGPAARPADAPPPAPTPAAPVIPGFTVIGLLGRGGFGSVWDARAASGVAAAVKVNHGADEEATDRLGREGGLLERIGPPHVPAVLARGTLPDGRAYLAIERLRSRTVAEELAAHPGGPGLPLLQRMGPPLLTAAAAIHARRVIHLDLKPENAFIDASSGEVSARFIDFGLAIPVGAPPHARSPADRAAGTPEYMSPEQIAGGPLDLQADVYALGVMLYELATLRPPFVGERRDLEYAHLSFRPPRPSRFAPLFVGLEEVILRCLAKEPAARFADAGALRAAFAEALAGAARPERVAAAGAAVAARAVPTVAAARQKAALIFLQVDGTAPLDIQNALAPFGGQLAHLAAGRCVCAFTHRAGDHPAQRAFAAAQALRDRGLARRLLVDIDTVSVKSRPGGPPRLSSPAFSQESRFPGAADTPGILLTAAARETLPAVACEPAPSGRGLFVPTLVPDSERTRIVPAAIGDAAAPMYGRDRELEALVAEATHAVAERRPRVATVLGEPGHGKTRLAFELGRRLRQQHLDAEVIELHGREPLGTDADETLVELLHQTLTLPPGLPAEDGRALLRDRLGEGAGEAATAAALLLGWISPDHPAVQSLRAAPGVLRANVARAGVMALHRLAATRPVLVLLDDAHWADDTLLDTLEQATVSELPLWVCAFGRPGFADSRPTFGQRAGRVHSDQLGPLPRASAAELCRRLLEPASRVPESMIDRLIDRAQCIPLLLCDLVRGLRQAGLVRERAGGAFELASELLDQITDSPLFEWLASRELEELPAGLAAHARLLSILAPEFELEEVDGVLAALDREMADAFPLDARVGTTRLEQTGLLSRRRSGRFLFRNEMTREAVAKTVAGPLATRLHRAAFEYYRSVGADMADAHRLPRLAWHAAAVGEREQAAATYLQLAEAARGRHAFVDADLLYSRALAHLDPSDEPRRLTALRGRGVMRYRVGRHDDSLADLAQARELAMRGQDATLQAEVLLEESMALDWLLEWQRSREVAELAERLTADQGGRDPLLRAGIQLALGRSAHRFTQDRQAAEMLREAARLAESAGDAGYEIRVAANLLLGFLLPFIGLPDEAEERLEQIRVLCEAKGDVLHLSGLWGNRACLWVARNDKQRFLEDIGRTLELCRRTGNALVERNANLNSAYFLYWRGELDEALPYAHRLIEVDERYFLQGGLRPDGPVLLARILWAAGRLQEAGQVVAKVLQHQAEARARNAQELILLPNDQMLLEVTLLLLHGGDTSAWTSVVARGREVAQGQELIEVLELAGIAARDRGEYEVARRFWHEALEAGERIPNVMSERIRGHLLH
jgi:tetratricopeptide (TPR) repeat protein